MGLMSALRKAWRGEFAKSAIAFPDTHPPQYTALFLQLALARSLPIYQTDEDRYFRRSHKEFIPDGTGDRSCKVNQNGKREDLKALVLVLLLTRTSLTLTDSHTAHNDGSIVICVIRCCSVVHLYRLERSLGTTR